MSSEQDKLPEQCLKQAAEWYWTIREADVSDRTIDEWQVWLSASPIHKRAFERIQSTLEVVDGIESPSWPTGQEIAADQYDGSIAIKEWRARNPQPGINGERSQESYRRSRSHSRIWAIAASLFLVFMVGAAFQYRSWFVPESPPDYVLYQTQPAEHRDILLSDGSSVALGGKSTISVAYQQDQRLVVLREGEAYFDVAKDASRPFTVEAEGRDITAVGTAFNVSNQHARVVVTVTEGTVIVVPEAEPVTAAVQSDKQTRGNFAAMARLEAGQKLIYDDQVVMPISVINPADAISWREGLLKYRGEPLRYVIEDVSRYITYPVSLGDQAAGDVLFTGTVIHGNADTWVFGLEDAFPVDITETAEGVVINMRVDITH